MEEYNTDLLNYTEQSTREEDHGNIRKRILKSVLNYPTMKTKRGVRV
jgi:hypothetical protein